MSSPVVNGSSDRARSRQLQGKTYEEWVQEMVGMRTMLAKWANVSEFDIFGMRAPRLKPGDNRQFDVSDRCSAGVL